MAQQERNLLCESRDLSLIPIFDLKVEGEN